MATLALAPTRLAPAATIRSKSSSVRMPPDAFTPNSEPTAARINATSSAVAPAVLNLSSFDEIRPGVLR
jgi:hypothetical protein